MLVSTLSAFSALVFATVPGVYSHPQDQRLQSLSIPAQPPTAPKPIKIVSAFSQLSVLFLGTSPDQPLQKPGSIPVKPPTAPSPAAKQLTPEAIKIQLEEAIKDAKSHAFDRETLLELVWQNANQKMNQTKHIMVCKVGNCDCNIPGGAFATFDFGSQRKKASFNVYAFDGPAKCVNGGNGGFGNWRFATGPDVYRVNKDGKLDETGMTVMYKKKIQPLSAPAAAKVSSEQDTIKAKLEEAVKEAKAHTNDRKTLVELVWQHANQKMNQAKHIMVCRVASCDCSLPGSTFVTFDYWRHDERIPFNVYAFDGPGQCKNIHHGGYMNWRFAVGPDARRVNKNGEPDDKGMTIKYDKKIKN